MKLPDYVASFFASRGAEQLFAISGASNLRLLDAFARHPALRYVCPHHEQAGVMAAITYTRLSRRPGIMMVTAGPGAANTITGLASAYLDSIPIFVIAGQEKSDYLAPGYGCRGKGVQGLPMVRIVEPVTKMAVTVTHPTEIRSVLERAFHEAYSGRPGPVWIEIPQDLQTADIDPDSLPGFTAPAAPAVDYTGAAQRTIALLRDAERPLLWVGHGIRLADCVAEFRDAVVQLGVPVLAAWNGADLIEESHPLYAGRAGTYGQRAGNFAVQNCDLLIALGTRLAIPQMGYVQKEFARAARKVVIEIDPAELAKLDPAPDLSVCGDVGAFLRALLAELAAAPANRAARTGWVERCARWRREYPPVTDEHRLPVAGKINSYDFIDQLSDALAPDDVIVTDMGTSLTCTHAAIRLQDGQRLVTSTGLGEMGFGLPGAIGASLGAPERRVVFVGTEGSLMMNLQELQTVIHLQLPLKIFILNNNGYLTIRHTEQALFGDRLTACSPETGVTFPDLLRLAGAFGFPTFEVDDRARCGEVIRAALAQPGAVFCNVKMPEDQFLGPKTAVKVRPDGSLVSPPLEDLFPFLPRPELADNMIVPLLSED
ncbi:MAG: thiamine pyrophosphate-binding protein [Acidobacteriota bacterium]